VKKPHAPQYVWVKLNGGPFDNEERQVLLGPDGPPNSLQCIDSEGTFANVLSGMPGEEVPLQLELYERRRRTEIGVWVYEHSGSSSGRFTYAS
jgi:hypothetical protein